MNTDRDSFSQFGNLDAKARLDEFDKFFNQVKSQFPRSMLEPTSSHPSMWTNPSNNPNNQQSASVNHNIDSHSQQQQQHFDPMNDSRFQFIHDTPSFFRSRFRDTFGSDYTPEEQQKEHRVHHIPIHIEPRDTGSSSTEYRAQQPTATAVAPPTPAPPSIGAHQYYQQQPKPSSNDFYLKSASPRVVSVPIQICKSPSTPSTVSDKSSIPKQQQQPTSQNYPMEREQYPKESASDPAIADPNKVYPMSYDPLQNKNEAEEKKECDINENKQENKLPQVVALTYESPIVNKPMKVDEQQQQASNMLDDDKGKNIQQANQEEMNQISVPQEQQKEETPFDYIDEILDDLHNWEQQVIECNATTADDKGYRWLDEMLTLCVLRLDCISIDGNDELRKYRKQAINEVNRVVLLLESKIDNKQQKDDEKNNEIHNENTQANNDNSKNTNNNDKNNKSNESSKDSKKKEKDKNKKESGKRMIFFKKKTPNNAQPLDTDNNNNDLKDNRKTDDTSSSQSSNSAVILAGRETEV